MLGKTLRKYEEICARGFVAAGDVNDSFVMPDYEIANASRWLRASPPTAVVRLRSIGAGAAVLVIGKGVMPAVCPIRADEVIESARGGRGRAVYGAFYAFHPCNIVAMALQRARTCHVCSPSLKRLV